MNFSILSDCHEKWLDILVIGKNIEQDGRKYHILGMTLSDEAKLYIIEPYDKWKPINRKGICNYRWRLKEYKERSCCYLHCSEFYLGDEKLQVQGGMSSRLEHSLKNYGTFLKMHLKPDQETGTHGLSLKDCVIQTPVSPDTTQIPAELFLYYEKIDA